jgi:hypothetical protein
VKLSHLIAETAPCGTWRDEHRAGQSEHDSERKSLPNRYESFHIVLLASLDVAAGGLLKSYWRCKKFENPIVKSG